MGYLTDGFRIKGNQLKPMKAVIQLLKRHPVIITFYLIITFYCVRVTLNIWRFYDYMRQQPNIGGHAAGAGTAIWAEDIGMFLFGGIFFLVCGCLAIAYKAETRFYLWLGLIAILQPIVFLQIGDIHSI